MRRGMLFGLAPPRAQDGELSFALLRGVLARRRVRVLDLTRSTDLLARIEHPSREGTVLEGPWASVLWAARWGGASHLLVSDASFGHASADGNDRVASGALSLLNLPGAETVWVARATRHGSTDDEARARVVDALLDALHGSVRDDLDASEPSAPAAVPPAPRPHRHRARRHTR